MPTYYEDGKRRNFWDKQQEIADDMKKDMKKKATDDKEAADTN